MHRRVRTHQITIDSQKEREGEREGLLTQRYPALSVDPRGVVPAPFLYQAIEEGEGGDLAFRITSGELS